MKKPLSKTIKNFFGIGDVGFVLMSNLDTYFFTFFLTDVALFPVAIMGLITTVISTVDMCLAPFYGAVMNRMKPMKWGRYRSWLLIGPPIVALFYPFYFSKIGSDMTAAIIIIVAGILYKIGFNFAFTANVTLIPLMASTDAERKLLSSRRMTFYNGGRLLVSYFVPMVVAWMTGFVSGSTAYSLTALILSICFIFTYLIHFNWAKDYDNAETSTEKTEENKQNVTFKDMFGALTQNKSLLALFIANCATIIPTFVINALATYYFTYVAENKALLSTYLLFVNLSGIVGAYVVGLLPKTLDSRKIILSSYCIMIAALVLARVFAFKPYIFMVFFAINQFMSNFNYPLVIAMYGDCAIYGEYKTGKDVNGFVMGLTNIPMKVGTLLRGVVLAVSFQIIGYQAGVDPTPAVKSGICNTYVGVPLICILIGLVTLLFGYKLTKPMLEEAKAAIEARKAAQ